MERLGEVVLNLVAENLDLNLVESILGISATKVMRKGDVIANSYVSTVDIWQHKRTIGDEKEIESVLLSTLKPLIEKGYSSYVQKALKNVDASITVYLRPSSDQFGFSLSQEIIQKLASLHFGISFDLLL